MKEKPSIGINERKTGTAAKNPPKVIQSNNGIAICGFSGYAKKLSLTRRIYIMNITKKPTYLKVVSLKGDNGQDYWRRYLSNTRIRWHSYHNNSFSSIISTF